jgi:hypothetical protein
MKAKADKRGGSSHEKHYHTINKGKLVKLKA